LRPWLIIALLYAFSHAGLRAQEVAADAISTGHWTQAEQKQFSDCVAPLNAECKAAYTRACSTPAERWCEVWEEGQHWAHAHPGLSLGKEDHAKFHQCNRAHTSEMNGTPKQFYAAMDFCLREAYGLTTSGGK
jgi:hypothetical protein